jgi:hypothetical protein
LLKWGAFRFYSPPLSNLSPEVFVWEGDWNKMVKYRNWLFRGSMIIAIGLMILSWFMTWWECTTPAMSYWVRIHPWGLDANLGVFIAYIEGSDMPVWFAPFMWIYFGICIAALLYSLVAKEKVFTLGKLKLPLPQIVIGGVGLSYIIVVILAVIVAAIRSGDFFNMSLVGFTYIEEAYGNVYGTLLPGYWLACVTGPLLVFLAVFRNKIIGRKNKE